MKKNLKTACAKVTAVALALAMVASAAPANAAKAKKPALSTSKATITVGKTKKITVKKAKPKKTTWTVNKKGKKIVKLTKKKKTSVTIKALKKGSATVTAKIKVGKKNYTKKVKVTVEPKTTPTKSAVPATSKAPVVSNAPASKAPVSNAPASKAPVSNAPVSKAPEATPTPEPTPYVPEGNEFKIVPSADNQWDGVSSDYYGDLTFPEGEGVVFTSTDDYNSCAAFYLKDGLTVDVSDFDTLEVDLVCAFDQFEPGSSVAKEAALKVWGTGATDFWGKTDGDYEGDPSGKTAARVWEIPLSKLVGNGVNLSDIKAIGAVVNKATGDQVKVKSFTFKKNTENFVSKDVPKAISIKQAEGLTKVEEGKTLDLVATVTNKNGAALDEAAVNWSSDAEGVATVENGKVTGVSAGKATITATVKDHAEVMATYEVEVYNNNPASIAIQVENNYKAYTVDELLEKNEGMAVKGVLLNANGDVVGDTTSQNITVKNAGTTGAQIKDGVLTATAAGTIVLELAATDDFEAVTLDVEVVKGMRVPFTSECVKNGSQDAAKGTHASMEIKNGVATLTGVPGTYNIGFDVEVDLGAKTVADYKGIRFAYSDYEKATTTGDDTYRGFTAYANPDFSVSASDGNGLACGWGGAKSLGKFYGDALNEGTATATFDYVSGSHDTSATTLRVGIKFEGFDGTGKVNISDIILLEK